MYIRHLFKDNEPHSPHSQGVYRLGVLAFHGFGWYVEKEARQVTRNVLMDLASRMNMVKPERPTGILDICFVKTKSGWVVQ